MTEPFYKSYYHYVSVCKDGDWTHGRSLDELRAEFDGSYGTGALDAFVKNNGAIEYPIYGRPVENGSMWVEDASSVENAQKRVEELNEKAATRLAPVFQKLKQVLITLEDNLWGPSKLDYLEMKKKLGSEKRTEFVENVAASLLSNVTPEIEEKVLFEKIQQSAAELMIVRLMSLKALKEGEAENIAKVAALIAYDALPANSIKAENLPLDKTTQYLLKADELRMEDVAKFEVFVKAFRNRSLHEWGFEDFVDDLEISVHSEFKDCKKNGLQLMKMIEAANNECDRLAEKYDLNRGLGFSSRAW